MCKCNTTKTSFTSELKKAVVNQNKTGNDYGVFFDESGNPYNLTISRISEIDTICCYYVPTNFNESEFNGKEFQNIHK